VGQTPDALRHRALPPFVHVFGEYENFSDDYTMATTTLMEHGILKKDNQRLTRRTNAV
jgi:hypothetical protein